MTFVQEICQMRELENVLVNSRGRECDDGASFLLVEGERQLAALYQAVLNLHGPEEAQKAAEDWLCEFERVAAHNEPIQWRRISVAVADRLASRLTDGERPPTHDRSWRMFRTGTRQLLQCPQPCKAC